MSTIWKYIKYAIVGLTVSAALLLVWGVFVEPRLIDYKEEIVVVPNLPSEWENKKIAVVADLQVGMWLGNEDTAKKIVSRIIEERPAAVLVAGDFVYHPMDDDREDAESDDALDFMSEVNESVALLKPLVEAGIPTYAVLGNHDYGMGYTDSPKNAKLASAVREKLEAAGVSVLENAASPLVLRTENSAPNAGAANDGGAALYIAGIGSRYAGNDQPETALAQIPDGAPRVIFMHNPDSFAAFPANAAPLAIAGHTHGGQIRVPFTENWSWMSLASKEKIHSDGWIENFGAPGNRLYVNRGIGFSSIPVRINCRPELTVFTLRGRVE